MLLRNENRECFEEVLADYVARFQSADEVERGLIEEMAVAYRRTRRSWAIETRMLDDEMDARSSSPTELDRLDSAFGDPASTTKLNLLRRYQTRLHNFHSRYLKDLAILRPHRPRLDRWRDVRFRTMARFIGAFLRFRSRRLSHARIYQTNPKPR